MLSYPLRLYRGDTYRWRYFLWADHDRSVPIDLAGVIVGAEIRQTTGGTPVTALGCAVTAPNQIDVSLSAASCASLPASALWDLQLTYANGDVQTVVSGPVSVQGDVTGSVAMSGVLRV